MAKPVSTEFPSFYKRYIELVPEGDLVEMMAISQQKAALMVQNLSQDQLAFRYAEGKWTIKDIIVHLSDTERVFAYRAMRIARKDKTSLPSFDENNFAWNAHANNRDIRDILREYKAVRMATIELFKTFSEENLLEIGNVNNNPMSTRAMGYAILGHTLHHLNIIKERYLWQTSDIVFV
jgi:uncharacterized damage-inducible protein DinB